MTRQQFIEEAKRRGKSKEETRAKFEALEASGAFDDNTSQPEPQSKGFIPQQVDYLKSIVSPLSPKNMSEKFNDEVTRIGETSAERQARGGNKNVENILGVAKTAINAPINAILGTGLEMAGNFIKPAVNLSAYATNKIPGYTKNVAEPTGRAVERGVAAIGEGIKTLPISIRQAGDALGVASNFVPAEMLLAKGLKAAPTTAVKILNEAKPIAKNAIKNTGKFFSSAKETPKNILDGRSIASAPNIKDIENGLEVVDDIDKIPTIKLGPAIEDKRTFSQIKKETEQPFNSPKKLGILPSGIDEIEAMALAVPEEPGTIGFKTFVEQAKRALPRIDANGNSVPTALDIVGRREFEAMQILEKIKNSVGQQKNELVKKATEAVKKEPWGETTGLVDTAPIKKTLENLVNERMGGSVGRGELSSLPNRTIDPTAAPIINQTTQYINSLPNAATVQQVDDVIRRLRELTEKSSATRTKPQYFPEEALALKIRDELKNVLDGHIAQQLGPEDAQKFSTLNSSYANLIKIQDTAQRRFGAVIGEGADKMLSRGAGVARAAVANNSDLGSKALFESIKKYTGVDLYRESLYAWIATKAVGDTRGIDLVEAALKGGDFARRGITGKAELAIAGLSKMAQGNKLKNLVEYYDKMQGRAKPKNPQSDYLSKFKDSYKKSGLSSESGAIGSYYNPEPALKTMGLTPAIRDVESGKIFKGPMGHKHIFNSQIERELPGARDKIWRELFKDNTGKYSDYIGFVDKEGNFITRKSAEEAAQRPKSLAQMFHDQDGAIGQINPQVKSENFKKWFGDWEKAPEQASKVVDESGKPLVVYHGTNAKFNAFNEKYRNTGYLGTGYNFTTRQDIASNYGNKKIAAYLDIKNPLVLGRTLGEETAARLNKIFPQYQLNADDNGVEAIKLLQMNIKNAKDSKNFVDKLENSGYDGIIHDWDKGDKVILAFRPEQIKSATGNSGAYNPKNPDIRGNIKEPLKMLGLTGAGAGAALGAGLALERYRTKKAKK